MNPEIKTIEQRLSEKNELIFNLTNELVRLKIENMALAAKPRNAGL